MSLLSRYEILNCGFMLLKLILFKYNHFLAWWILICLFTCNFVWSLIKSCRWLWLFQTWILNQSGTRSRSFASKITVRHCHGGFVWYRYLWLLRIISIETLIPIIEYLLPSLILYINILIFMQQFDCILDLLFSWYWNLQIWISNNFGRISFVLHHVSTIDWLWTWAWLVFHATLIGKVGIWDLIL